MFVLFPAQRDVFHTPVVRYSLFVPKVPLNNNKPNQTLPSDWTKGSFEKTSSESSLSPQ